MRLGRGGERPAGTEGRNWYPRPIRYAQNCCVCPNSLLISHRLRGSALCIDGWLAKGRECSAGMRHNNIRRGAGGTMANVSLYPRQLAHAHRHTFRRPPWRRFLYLSPLLWRFIPTPTPATACVLLPPLLLSALIGVYSAFSTVSSSPCPAIWVTHVSDQTSREQRERVPSRSSSLSSPSPSPRIH